MRLHSLSVTAFGPFADTVNVDFDALGQAGLFLLSGATGAGKTSVLDAVCFGLYGEVPGDRNTAKRLRSDQAPQDVAPVVELEVTLATRRFRLRRSPQWQRPKRRGHGITTQQASVVVQEQVDGAWTTRTTRLDEAGHLISGLLGMNLNQFCQVALLPQGRFQAFLRARSEERQQLLQQLFRTQRFGDIESWLAEHRRSVRRACSAAEGTAMSLATRLSEASGAPRPADGGDEIGNPQAIRAWASHVVQECAATRLDLVDERALLAESLAEARLVHEEVVRRSRMREQYLEARAEHVRLLETSDEHTRRRSMLALATKAESLAPLVQLWERARGVHGEAAAEIAVLAAGIGLEVVDFAAPDPHLLAMLDHDRVELAALRALSPQAEELDRLSVARERWSTEVEELSVAAQRLAADQAAADGEVVLLSAAVAQAEGATAQLVELRSRAEAVGRQLEAHDQASDLQAESEVAARELAAQRDSTLALKEVWLEIREARLNGMAAEIATRLVVGGSCPVCGSAEHPHVAQPTAQAPDAGSERVARASLDDAEAALHAHEDRYRELAIRFDLAQRDLGDTTRDACLRQADELADEVDRLGAVAESLAPARAALTTAEEEVARTRTDLQGHLASLGSLGLHLEQSEPLFNRLCEELDGVLSRHDADTLDGAIRQLSAQVKTLELAHTVRLRCESSYADLERNRRALADASSEAGFRDVDALRAASLAPDRRSAIEAEVATFDARMMTVRQQLDSPELRAAAEGEPGDPGAANAVLDAAQAAFVKAESRLSEATTRSGRVESLADELNLALDAWEPITDELELAVRMAGLAEGTSPDNTLQMRLSAFVLAYRLGQVVGAANDRLLRMSDQRYSLEHSEQRGAGERRGGLSLLVRDDWSGESRDPATLSGGETFVVSLALALGLADVISHEIGGADLDTLFVDEGFGALDSETLDDVMDTLDSLREGGRVVGVVSHVAEMRHRIPTRLHVTKRRTGSTVSLIHGS